MSLLLLAATSALAAPSSSACQAWATKLKGAANDTLAGLSQLEDPRIQGLRGTISPGPVLASVNAGVCRIQTVGTVDLVATLALPAMGGHRALTCPVKVRRAVVPLIIQIGGSDTAPRVRSSTLPIEALGPYLTTCVNASWVEGAVLKVASNWVAEQTPSWHGQLEAWLVQ